MNENNKVQQLIDSAMTKIKDMGGSDTVFGTPLDIQGMTIIPVSRVQYGFAGGGSDLPMKDSSAQKFGGGSGGGVSVTPVACLVIRNNNVEVLPLIDHPNSMDVAVNKIVDLLTSGVDFAEDAIRDKKAKNNADDFVTPDEVK